MTMKEIIPVIMDTSFNRLAMVDDYISIIWTSRYYTSGDFELVLDATKENLQIIAKDYFVVREDDDNVGIVEDIKITRDSFGQERMIVTGRFLQSILARRIIGAQTTVTGKLSACVETLIDENIINPVVASRQIANFTVQAYTVNTTMKAQYTGKNLLEVVSDICKTYGVGFKVTLNDNHEFVFQLYEGVDRTYDQSTNTWVIFSDTYDNLMSSEYEECYKNMATAVLVAGEGEGLERKTEWVSDGTTGLARREVFKDQRNIRSESGMTEEEYMELLQQSGLESLTKYTTAFTGTVYFDNITYKQDVNLGDLCVIENSRWGLSINSRLVEVIESVSESGQYTILPTFGT